MKYFIYGMLAMFALGALSARAVDFEPDYLKVKCRTPNGAIIVVEGNCPAGTTYAGPA